MQMQHELGRSPGNSPSQESRISYDHEYTIMNDSNYPSYKPVRLSGITMYLPMGVVVLCNTPWRDDICYLDNSIVEEIIMGLDVA